MHLPAVENVVTYGSSLCTDPRQILHSITLRSKAIRFATHQARLSRLWQTAVRPATLGDNASACRDMLSVALTLSLTPNLTLTLTLTPAPTLQVFLIMELLLGGELLDAVLTKGSYSEADARLCFVQLLRGVHYLHSRWALSHLNPTSSLGAWRTPIRSCRTSLAPSPGQSPTLHPPSASWTGT